MKQFMYGSVVSLTHKPNMIILDFKIKDVNVNAIWRNTAMINKLHGWSNNKTAQART
jgi:hypothetical protein